MFFNILSVATVALAAVTSVGALVIPRAAAPSSYDSAVLEVYTTYNTRYTALNCENQHGTTFFDTCCHPLKAGESLSSRPAECNPANLAASPTSSGAVPTATDDSDLPFCDEEPDSSSSTPSSTSTPTPAPTPAGAVAAAPTPSPITDKASKTSKTHTTSHTHTPAASPAAAAAPAAASPNSQVNTGGVATFFFQNGVAGACGTVHSDSALIAAIDQARYGDSSQESPLCGKQVHITNTNNGKSVTVTIADDCPTCINSNSIDLSTGAFTQIATEEEGEVPISWYFV